MFTNWDARDVGSLEEVFRSHEFGRATDARWGRGGEGSRWLPSAGARPGAGGSEETEVPQQPTELEPSGGGAALDPGAPGGAVDGTAQATRDSVRDDRFGHRARRARWQPGSWPGRATTRGRVFRHRARTRRRVRTAAGPAPARCQPARQLPADRSRLRPGPAARRLARPRTQGSVRATRQGDTFRWSDRRHSPAPRPRPRRRVALQASAAGRRVPRRRPAAPIRWHLPRRPSGAR